MIIYHKNKAVNEGMRIMANLELNFLLHKVSKN